MVTTTDVVQRKSPFRDTYRRHGYFFKEAAILTILMGFGLHLYRVIFGDELTLQYVMTPTTDMVLMMPMTYAAMTGICCGTAAIEFVNRTAHGVLHMVTRLHRAERAAAHLLRSGTRQRRLLCRTSSRVWFSYLLFPFYAGLITMFWRLRFRN